ncbi:MAG: DUF3784 domain-containing protein [Peptostreptococcaceae bacterium]|nr:DUF3784 domain-containing protein [Peptostreptococcaceae bacterium]
MLYFLAGGLCWLIAVMQFMEKGFVFNKRYVYATEEERKKMDKKVYYRQAGIEWLLFGSYFILMGLSSQWMLDWLRIPAWICLGLVILYSVRFNYRMRPRAKD